MPARCRFLTLPAWYAEQGLLNCRASVRPSVRPSVPSLARRTPLWRVRCWAPCRQKISTDSCDRSSSGAAARRTAANSARRKCEQCRVDSWRRKLKTDLQLTSKSYQITCKHWTGSSTRHTRHTRNFKPSAIHWAESTIFPLTAQWKYHHLKNRLFSSVTDKKNQSSNFYASCKCSFLPRYLTVVVYRLSFVWQSLCILCNCEFIKEMRRPMLAVLERLTFVRQTATPRRRRRAISDNTWTPPAQWSGQRESLRESARYRFNRPPNGRGAQHWSCAVDQVL